MAEGPHTVAITGTGLGRVLELHRDEVERARPVSRANRIKRFVQRPGGLAVTGSRVAAGQLDLTSSGTI